MTIVVGLLAALVSVVGLRDTPRRPALALVPVPAELTRDVPRPVTLEVLVKERGGATLAGANVRLFWEDEGRYYEAGSGSTGVDGRLRVAHVPRGRIWVLARHAGHARACKVVMAEGLVENVELELGPQRHVVISVRTESAEPVAGATVLAYADDPLPYAVLSDADGKAPLELGDPPWELTVAARGYEPVRLFGVEADRMVSLAKLATLEVSVRTEEGAPAADALVLIVGSKLWPARKATTDEAGKVRIGGLESGVYDLKAVRKSETSGVVYGVEIEAGRDKNLELVLAPGRMVTAWVAEVRGEEWISVADADVVLVEGGMSSFPSRGRSGSDGRVRLGPIGSGDATLVASARGFISGPATATRASDSGEVRVPVVRGGRLLGDVVDARGFPIAGASIEVVGTDFEGMPLAETPRASEFRRAHFEWALPGPPALVPAGELGVMPGPVPPIPLGVAPPGLTPSAEPTAWVSNANGEFSAWPVSPGRVRAFVRHPAYVEGLSDEVVLHAGGEARVKVVLRGGGLIEGRVLDHREFPLPGGRVALYGVSAALERVTLTSEDGSFTFASVPEVVLLEVHDPDDFGRVLVRKRVEVPEDKTVRLELILPEPRDPVEIRVTDTRGDPVTGVEVRVASLDAELPLRRTLFSDASGAVTIPGLRGVRLVVEAARDGHLTASQTFDQAPAEIGLKLVPGILVRGRITAVRGRAPVSGARVTLVGAGYRRAATTDAYGEFELAGIPPGAVMIEARHPDYAFRVTRASVARTERDDRSFELPPIDLETGSRASGRVVDAEGRPVPGARVGVGSVPDYLPAGALPAGIALSDALGRFELAGLAEGKQTLEAYSAALGRGRAEISILGGLPMDGVEIRLSGLKEPHGFASSVSVAVTLGTREAGPDLVELVIEQVGPNSEAERAGVLAGDVLVAVGGTPVPSQDGARRLLDGPLGSDVVLELRRAGERLLKSVPRETVRR